MKPRDLIVDAVATLIILTICYFGSWALHDSFLSWLLGAVVFWILRVQSALYQLYTLVERRQQPETPWHPRRRGL